MKNKVDSIVLEAREINRRFEELIIPHRTALWKYCRYITKSPWDGEDLFQDTMLKSFASLSQLWQPVKIKPYLFRIATNTWIDQLRKNKVILDTYEDVHGDIDYDKAEITEAMEIILSNLPPKQIAVVLLMDVFEFSARETANMIRLTEGAVYSALHRARKNLKSLHDTSQKSTSTVIKRNEGGNCLIDELITAINNGDSEFIVHQMSEAIHNNASPGFQEFSKKDMLKGSFDHNPGEMCAYYTILWGKPVIVVQVKIGELLKLHDVRLFEINNGQIVYHRGYYFCREFLFEVGKELGIPVQLTKHPDIDWTSGFNNEGENK